LLQEVHRCLQRAVAISRPIVGSLAQDGEKIGSIGDDTAKKRAELFL
jgi:hypothetical protein